jgi:predicted transglutaminase-like cysteine proteinase
MNKTGAKMTRKFIAMLALGLGLSVSTSAVAELRPSVEGQDLNSPFLREYGRTLPPIGHVGFCRRLPEECAPHEALNAPVALTDEKRRELRDINNLVNQMIRPVTDQDLYGRIEHWTYPAGKGDCEDYVLLKRRLLMERGWPSGALLITVVRDENNDGHAVLTVRTSEGDLVLDNKRSAIITWNQSNYRFVKWQANWDPQTWISLAAPTRRRWQGAPVSANR